MTSNVVSATVADVDAIVTCVSVTTSFSNSPVEVEETGKAVVVVVVVVNGVVVDEVVVVDVCFS